MLPEGAQLPGRLLLSEDKEPETRLLHGAHGHAPRHETGAGWVDKGHGHL